MNELDRTYIGRPILSYNTEFLYRHWGEIHRYLNQRNIPVIERQEIINLFSLDYNIFKIVKRDMNLTTQEKEEAIINIIIKYQPPTISILGNQGSGKDVTATYIIEKLLQKKKYRICTYLSWTDYPFMNPEDKYFLLEDVPSGTNECPVILYISELDLAFPARNFKNEENDILNTQLNILRQNNIMIIGTAKVAANVDISYWRHYSMGLFKYIDKNKLLYSERKGFINEQMMFMLPRNRDEKTDTLFNFGDLYYIFKVKQTEWYTDDISKQYSKITNEQKKAYAEMLKDKGLKQDKIDKEMKRLFKNV